MFGQSRTQAIFLQHEGYLGALGALVSYGDPTGEILTLDEEIEKCCFPASTIEATFGKVNSRKLSKYRVEDLAASLSNLLTNNTVLSGLNRIFFRGAYVCGHKNIMDEISSSIKYCSKGVLQTTFMCHEGFLGQFGAFCSYETMGIDDLSGARQEDISEVLLGSPYTGLFPPFPLARRETGETVIVQGKIESLRHDNGVLKAEIERLQLQRENAGLKAKLVDNVLKGELERLQKENAELNAK